MNKNIDNLFDEFLNIQTGVDKTDIRNARKIFFNYGATEYSFLEDLFTKYPFNCNDHIVDFGCGKGRVLIMAAYYQCKHITGYELDKDRYDIAHENIIRFQLKFNNNSIFEILNENVEKINIADTTNRFFFFNPFYLKVYIKVLRRIQASLQRNKREIYIFLYKPQDSTVKYIDSLNDFKKLEIKKCNYTEKSTTYNYFEFIIYSNNDIIYVEEQANLLY